MSFPILNLNLQVFVCKETLLLKVERRVWHSSHESKQYTGAYFLAFAGRLAPGLGITLSSCFWSLYWGKLLKRGKELPAAGGVGVGGLHRLSWREIWLPFRALSGADTLPFPWSHSFFLQCRSRKTKRTVLFWMQWWCNQNFKGNH